MQIIFLLKFIVSFLKQNYKNEVYCLSLNVYSPVLYLIL